MKQFLVSWNETNRYLSECFEISSAVLIADAFFSFNAWSQRATILAAPKATFSGTSGRPLGQTYSLSLFYLNEENLIWSFSLGFSIWYCTFRYFSDTIRNQAIWIRDWQIIILSIWSQNRKIWFGGTTSCTYNEKWLVRGYTFTQLLKSLYKIFLQFYSAIMAPILNAADILINCVCLIISLI